MLISFLLVSSLLLIDSSTGCCCNIKWSCGCNAFGCNCVTVNGWCKKVYDSVTHGGHVLIQPLCSNPGFGFNSGCTVCWSSQGKKDQEYCPAERRRMKRSVSTRHRSFHSSPVWAAISQTYGEIHPDLIDRHEMEKWKRRTGAMPPSSSSSKLMQTMMGSKQLVLMQPLKISNHNWGDQNSLLATNSN